MNEHEIDRIANAVNVLRPDWPVASLKTLLARPALAHKTRRDVALALTWVACEADTQTPARVLESGPWWSISLERKVPRNPALFEECGTHPGQFAHNCSGCASERLAPVVELHPDAPPPDLSDVRAKLAAEREAYQAQVRNLRDQRNAETEEPA